jgi:hypothetical protein
MVHLKKTVLLLLLPLLECTPSSFLVYQFGDNDKLGTNYPEPEGSKDHILWEKESLPDKVLIITGSE